MEIQFLRCNNLQLAGHDSSKLCPYILWSCDYPSDTEPQKGKTGYSNGADAVFPPSVGVQRLHIARNRTVARRFSNLKLAVAVWHARGVLRSDMCIGKADLRFTELCTKSEWETTVELKHLESRKGAGTLTVRIRQRMVLPLFVVSHLQFSRLTAFLDFGALHSLYRKILII